MSRNEEIRRLDIVRKALRYWDPIGVIEDREAGTGIADDEYESYVAGLLGSLASGNDTYRISHHLAGIRHDSMAFGANRPTEREKDLANTLVRWRDQQFRGAPDFNSILRAI